MVNLRKKKSEGPLKASRILDTPEVKVDQVFTKDEEKPVALFLTTTEDEAKRIGAKGYAGPTRLGAEGEYERGKTWVTRAIYWPNNIPGAQFDENISGQIISAMKTAGTVVPSNIQFEKVENEKTIPVSGSAYLKTNYSGYAQLNGSFTVNASITKTKKSAEES